MSEENTKKPNSYPALFALVAFAILGATALLAIGGIYYSFINPSFLLIQPFPYSKATSPSEYIFCLARL